MTEKRKQIFIDGDVAIDHFYHPVPGQDQGENWELYPALQTTLIPGGAFILAKLVEEAVKTAGLKIEVSGQKPPKDSNGINARAMIQSKILLAKFEEKEKEKKTVTEKEYTRVSKYQGYSAPAEKVLDKSTLIKPSEDCELLILDDAGNGFRNHEELFPACIGNDKTMLVYKMSRPFAGGKLWEQVSERKGDWVLVLQAKDIRMCDNVHVSKGLSWERTAMEMVYQLKRTSSLSELLKAPYLVILFGNDGALLISRNPNEKPLLIFDPENLEGGFDSSLKGFGISTGAAFTASLSLTLVENGLTGIVPGIKKGLSAMRNLHKNGFLEINKKVEYNIGNVFTTGKHNFSECILDTYHDLKDADPDFWRILDKKTRLSKPLVTVDMVMNKSPEILKEIPVGKYFKMQTFDRSEIEQFNSIKNLILEYLDDPKTIRPLCLAVFGPPGSGKSFGIKQLLKSFDRENISNMTFNISQYASYDDLIADFHKVRDSVLKGEMPVAFFDEFDSDKDQGSMGWLKYFLAPMADGEFKEGEAVHPIGKSIFVFAGGTRSSYQKFEQNISSDSLQTNESAEEKRIRLAQFRDAKGPDFVSRLRGFINILGPNPNHQEGKKDVSFMIRRAKILRTNFEITDKTARLFNSQKVLQIDQTVLRAMLNIPEYKHGNRSMSAILDMSRLTDKTRFDLSALPTPDQLDVHVDAKLFMWLAAQERFYSLLPVEERFDLKEDCPLVWENKLIDKIAEKIHEDYYKQRKRFDDKTPSVVPWSELTDDKKRSNLDAAEHIPVKLSLIGHGICSIKDKAILQTPDISDAEIELLAKVEHERWSREQKIQGWKYGEERNNEKRIHPSLKPWDKLPESEKDKDREAIYALPRILFEAGYSIFRIENYDAINENLIMQIALALHEDYCKKRIAEGQTKQTNEGLVPFDELKQDGKEANLDSARSIPRKLNLLNIELKKSMPGVEPDLLVFTEDEIERLSQWEHTRWNWQKIMQGWVYGEKRDNEKKIHPYLLPWIKLTDDIKEYDRQSVTLMPGFIKNAGYNAIRTKNKS